MTHFPGPPPPPGGDPDQYLRFLTASVPVLLAYIDPQHHYRFANDAYARWFGRDLSSVIGKHVQEIIGSVAYEGIRN
jgi:PAS domain-containing protein